MSDDEEKQVRRTMAATRSPCPFCDTEPPEGEWCPSRNCRYLRALHSGEVTHAEMGGVPDVGLLVVQLQRGELLQLPEHLRNASFLSKKAGSFVGVSQRNVQFWTESDLLVPDVRGTSGRGHRRLYYPLNVIELAVIKSLAKEGLSLKIIRKAMLAIGAWAHHVFGRYQAYLLLYLSDDLEQAKAQPWWGGKSWDEALKGEKPEQYEKILVVNLTKIKEAALKAMA